MERVWKLTRWDGLVLLLKLSTLLSLISLDSFPFLSWEHLFVFNPELSTLEVHVIHSSNNMSRLLGVREVGKSKTSEDALVEVVIESVRKWELHLSHESDELLFLDSEGDVLDDDGGRDQLIVVPLGGRRATWSFHHLRVELAVHLVAVHVLRLLHLWVHPDLYIPISKSIAS